MIGLKRALAIAALALPLAGCFGKTSAENMTCPAASPVPDLQNIAIFGPGADRTVQNVRVAGKIIAASQECDEEKGGILVKTVITFTAGRTSPQVPDAKFPYFVAVVDLNQTILNEQRFTVPIKFTGSNFATAEEKISVHLPLQRVSAGRNFAVIVGFLLSPEQRDFNRLQAAGQQ
jgi:hypothetical protein